MFQVPEVNTVKVLFSPWGLFVFCSLIAGLQVFYQDRVNQNSLQICLESMLKEPIRKSPQQARSSWLLPRLGFSVPFNFKVY